MNIISWIVRGLANTDFRRVFREMISIHRPDIVILIETRISGDQANNVIFSLGYERFIKVDAMGFSEGIWVLWNPHTINVELISTTFHEIYLKI